MRKAALQHAAAEVNIARVFQHSRDQGLEHIPQIASTWSEKLHLDAKTIREYLTSNIDYSLDAENLQGLRLFYRYAAECDVLPPAPELRFVGQSSLASHP